MCVIDEYARRVRRWVWLRPRSPPRIAFIPATATSSLDRGLGAKIGKARSLKGANFCHVTRRREVTQDREVITEGNQKWQGAAPNLISNDKIRIDPIKLLF